MKRFASSLRSIVIDSVFPPTCAVCNQRGSWVCDICQPDYTPMVSSVCCDRCGFPVIRERCQCRYMHPAIVRARAFAAYDGWIVNAIRRLKYDRERDRAIHLADHLGDALRELGEIDALVPVPLHPNRFEWRGFNQAEHLARRLGVQHGIPVENALIRNRDTSIQAKSTQEERLANMSEAFSLHIDWALEPNAHYVLIDDVYTTGATVGACADALDVAGAAQISVLTVASDIYPSDMPKYKDLLRAAAAG